MWSKTKLLLFLRSAAEALSQTFTAFAYLARDCHRPDCAGPTKGEPSTIPTQRCPSASGGWKEGDENLPFLAWRFPIRTKFSTGSSSLNTRKTRRPLIPELFYWTFSLGRRSALHPHPVWWSSLLPPQRFLLITRQQAHNSSQPPFADHLRQLWQQKTQTRLSEVSAGFTFNLCSSQSFSHAQCSHYTQSSHSVCTFTVKKTWNPYFRYPKWKVKPITGPTGYCMSIRHACISDLTAA